MEVRGPARHPPGCLVAPLGASFRLYNPPGVETLEREELRTFSAATERKPTEKKKASPAGRFRRGDHFLEGEIVSIVFIIITGIIEIIININPNISTISISIPSHLTIATHFVIRTIYPLYSIGVDYYFLVNSIEFCWRNIIVSRLFAIHLSPLIMISFIFCE